MLCKTLSWVSISENSILTNCWHNSVSAIAIGASRTIAIHEAPSYVYKQNFPPPFCSKYSFLFIRKCRWEKGFWLQIFHLKFLHNTAIGWENYSILFMGKINTSYPRYTHVRENVSESFVYTLNECPYILEIQKGEII